MDDLVARLRARRITNWVHSTGETPRAKGYAIDTDCAEAAAEITALRAELELRRKSGSESDRLHNICQGLTEEAAGSAFSSEEWARIDEENAALRAQVEALRVDAAGKQAKIDALMAEYCPEEITPEQFDEWAGRQVSVSIEHSDAIDAALGIDRAAHTPTKEPT